MEPVSAAVGLGVGVASIASIFQTCLHGYRTLNTAMEIGSAATTLNIQFRVEELRLYLWGRSWGLAIELETNTNWSTNQPSDSENEDESVEVATSVNVLDSLDEDFEIPGLRDLIIQVLARISKALDDWRSLEEKYAISSSNTSTLGSSPQLLKTLLKDIKKTQTTQSAELSTRTKISKKLRWALTDKLASDGLLSKLTSLNDSLEKLLPKRERTSLARGLAGELLLLLENPNLNSSSNNGAQPNILEGFDTTKAAQILKLKSLNQTEVAEKEESRIEDGPSPFAKPSVWLNGEKEDRLIPFNHFLNLKEPKLEYVKEHRPPRSSDPPYLARPAPSIAVLAPSVSDAQLDVNPPAQMTLIEWRPASHESDVSQLTDEELKERRDHVARLLHQTSVIDADFRVLDCAGYTITTGHTSDGETYEMVGYTYRFPDFASTKTHPVSLRELLGEAYSSENPKVPPLEVRFKLARSISVALYQLQCAGWVHRRISSYNIIFFFSRDTEELDLSHPYLIGWQYSRPDDQRRIFPSERAQPGYADLDMYVHRRRLEGYTRRIFPRYRKSFDIYSLGIILIEIAFWEPIVSLAAEEQRTKMLNGDMVASDSLADEWWTAIHKVASEELAAEMGELYRSAVLFCLGPLIEKERSIWHKEYIALERNLPKDKEKYFVDTEYQEIGIEKDFYWNVLKPLERFGI